MSSATPTNDEQRTLDQLAEQLYAELLRRGYTEAEARSEVTAALEMWYPADDPALRAPCLTTPSPSS
jgi:hypothetical protein